MAGVRYSGPRLPPPRAHRGPEYRTPATAAYFVRGSLSENASMKERTPYSGRPRKRTTRLAVRIGEVLSRFFITIGGIGTIIAIVLVFAFLVYVVRPLFQSASVGGENHVAAWTTAAPIRMGVDEDQKAAWGLFSDGRLEFVDLSTGQVLDQKKLFDGPRLTAWSFAAAAMRMRSETGGAVTAGTQSAVFGFEDGSVRTGTIKTTTRFLDAEHLPEEVKKLEPNETIPFEKGLVTRIVNDQYRVCELAADIQSPAKGESPSPVLLVEQTKTTTGVVVAVLNAAGKLRLNTILEKEDLLT